LGTAAAPCRAKVIRGEIIKRRPHDRRLVTTENLMFRRFPLCLGVAAVAVAMTLTLAAPRPSWAQTPPPAAASPAPTPAPNPAPPPQATTPDSTEPFGEDITLTAKPIVYVKGSGTWDTAFETITASFKKLKTYVDKEALKTDGLPMTIFTATDDTGFQYQAAMPLAELPKTPPRGDILTGQSPEGHALKFIHHGSYEDLDNTYEAITNYLDDKRLEAKDMFIEEYVTDPVTADPNKLTVDVFVLLK
jgi:effector-binding domain-containing protein